MGLFGKFFSGQDPLEQFSSLDKPWDTEEVPIYIMINHFTTEEGILSDEMPAFPDEEQFQEKNKEASWIDKGFEPLYNWEPGQLDESYRD